VISAMLTALLAANIVVNRSRSIWPRGLILACLFAGLVAAYFVPFGRLPGSPAVIGSFAAIVFSVPVFFAGILFSREFKTAISPSAALGANVLGAVTGGLLENLSLITGMHALLLVTIGFYALAAVGLKTKPTLLHPEIPGAPHG